MKKCVFLDTKSINRDKQLFDTVERLYNDGVKTVIYTASEDRANEIDRFLWVSKQESFIPHKIFLYDESDALEAAAIVFREINPIGAPAIIADCPGNFHYTSKFETVFEFVDHSSEKALRQSRARYTKYKELGFEMIHEK